MKHLLSTLALLTAAFASAYADDTIVLKMAKGKKVTVEQTLELASDGLGENGKSAGSMSGNPDIKLVEKWTDECKEEEDGKAKEVERTFSSSKMTIWSDPAAATLTDGCVFTMKRGGETSTAEATKGSPEGKTTTLLGRAPIDPVELLLPTVAVKAGSTWEISEDRMLAFLDCVGASIPGAQGKSGKAVSMILGLALGNGKQSLLEAMPLKGKVVSIKAGVATLEITGTRTIEGDDLGKIKGYGKGFGKIGGTIKVNITTGMTERVDLVMNQLKGAGSGGPPPAATGGWQAVGFKDDWKLTRVYTPAK